MVVPRRELLLPHRRDGDEVLELPRGSTLLLAHLDAALLGDERGVHVVDGLLDPAAERAVQGRDREDARVTLGQLAQVAEVEPLGSSPGELDRERPEIGGQRDEGPQRLMSSAATRGR